MQRSTKEEKVSASQLTSSVSVATVENFGAWVSAASLASSFFRASTSSWDRFNESGAAVIYGQNLK
jgi:hypothetical protein